jgi:hypothetical protein
VRRAHRQRGERRASAGIYGPVSRLSKV